MDALAPALSAFVFGSIFTLSSTAPFD